MQTNKFVRHDILPVMGGNLDCNRRRKDVSEAAVSNVNTILKISVKPTPVLFHTLLLLKSIPQDSEHNCPGKHKTCYSCFKIIIS